MLLLGHTSQEDLENSANDLAAMSPAARRMLAEIVQEGTVQRQKASPSAEALHEAGFIFIREHGQYGMFDTGVTLTASLAGEEALEWLDRRREQKRGPRTT
ncbi:hypothetical protein H8Z72_23510 (plasmid) [Xanthomonas citri pv. citri]|uniref:hypothetical protein n=1 Tax=Xanthomonas citri TaxID=346 RepID=UPI001932F230|nr:hypothetical protein [Xanthomonas citri]QRD62717.1 hypothetical protein H8Z74_22675 [Xanthomonas citri pv. citri]QRD67044.1 hypothetical protein H8Z73_22760 [Xanthomonas citri pv. citri]QRD71703.1 hypothetical protein H8Z72_23510 [Xanthomonas citri pv. citri]